MIPAVFVLSQWSNDVTKPVVQYDQAGCMAKAMVGPVSVTFYPKYRLSNGDGSRKPINRFHFVIYTEGGSARTCKEAGEEAAC